VKPESVSIVDIYRKTDLTAVVGRPGSTVLDYSISGPLWVGQREWETLWPALSRAYSRWITPRRRSSLRRMRMCWRDIKVN